MEKTFKRETAWGLLFVLGVLFGFGLYTDNASAIDVAKFLTSPVFLFAAGAFGVDALAKQFGR